MPVFPSDPGVLQSPLTPLTSGQVLAGALCLSLLVSLNCGSSLYCGHPWGHLHLPAGVGGQSPAELSHVLAGEGASASQLQTPTCHP